MEISKSSSTGVVSVGPSSLPKEIMVGVAIARTPLAEFRLTPVGTCHNWRNSLHKRRYQATLEELREATSSDHIGRELTEALSRTIQQQITEVSTLTPHTTRHFSMQSDAFSRAFQSSTFTMSEFENGS